MSDYAQFLPDVLLPDASSYFLQWLEHLNAQSPDEEIFLSFGKCGAQQTSMGRQNDTGNPLNKPQGKKGFWKRNPTPVIIIKNWAANLCTPYWSNKLKLLKGEGESALLTQNDI